MNFATVCLYIIVAVISIILGYVIVKYCFGGDVSNFQSDIDGKDYAVRTSGNIETKQTAANYLAKISSKIDKLVDYTYANKLPDEDVANRLYSRWNKIKLKETNSNEKSAAYTLNKSVELRLCIRDSSGNFEDENTSMFIAIHELSHIMSIGFGHGEEFKANFNYLTHLASSLGLYKPEDFHNNPKTYCSTLINTSPCTGGSCSFNTLRV